MGAPVERSFWWVGRESLGTRLDTRSRPNSVRHSVVTDTSRRMDMPSVEAVDTGPGFVGIQFLSRVVGFSST